MLGRHVNRTFRRIFVVCTVAWLCLSNRQASAAVQQKQQQQTLSSSLPVIDGWSSLKISTQLAYAWSHQLQHIPKPGLQHRSDSGDSDGGGDGSSSNRTLFRVPRRGTSLAHLQTSVNRTVVQSLFELQGSLRVSNPDPAASIWVEQLQIECQWGLSLVLPCAAQPQQQPAQPAQLQHFWQQLQPTAAGVRRSPSLGSSSSSRGSGAVSDRPPALLINPGETALCSVRGMSVPAQWGTNFRQSCRVVATTLSGGRVQSGHFLLDFATADVMSLKNDCVRLSTKCQVTGSTIYQTPGVGKQQEQGVLVCDDKTLDIRVIVNDVYGLEGDMPDGCNGDTKLVCSSDITTLPGDAKTGKGAHRLPKSSSSSSSSRLSSSTLSLDIIPASCNMTQQHLDDLQLEAGELDEADAAAEQQELSEGADADEQEPPHQPSDRSQKGSQRMRQPRVSLHIDGTYIVSNYTWLLSSSVAPEALRVYANSTAAAQFTVSALRVPVRPAEPPKYYVDGTITVHNTNPRPIEVATVNAVLPWGQTALCKPAEDVVFPTKLAASGSLACTFRLQYELGLKPSSLRAHVTLVGSPQPLKSWPKPFSFKRANLAWSGGACARVAMSFTSDVTDVSVTHAGGEAPDFGPDGSEVCDDFAKWDFTVLVTPVGKVDGPAMVVANTVIKPTSLPGADPSSSLSRAAVTVLSVDVQPWPYNDAGPLMKATGSWRRGGEVPVVSAQSGDQFLFGEKNESITIRLPI